MTKNHTMGWLLLCTAVACGRSDADREEFERFMREGEAQANAAVEAAAARAAEPPAAITLAEVTVPDMGVAMQVPEGARTLADIGEGHLVLARGAADLRELRA